jgi:hypothetical protein
MPMVLWTRYFLEAQGYIVDDSKLYQDNQSSMLLEKNGKIRYFFVTDRIQLKEVSVDYCPAGDMRAARGY